MPAGRPSTYSDELAERICDQLADGRSLVSVCKDDAMPDRATVNRWLLHPDRDDFRAKYARAKEQQAEHLADEIVAIADDDEDDPQSRRVRVDARKWVAAKLLPRKYGDKLEVGGPNGGPVNVTIAWKEGA